MYLTYQRQNCLPATDCLFGKKPLILIFMRNMTNQVAYIQYILCMFVCTVDIFVEHNTNMCLSKRNHFLLTTYLFHFQGRIKLLNESIDLIDLKSIEESVYPKYSMNQDQYFLKKHLNLKLICK